MSSCRLDAAERRALESLRMKEHRGDARGEEIVDEVTRQMLQRRRLVRAAGRELTWVGENTARMVERYGLTDRGRVVADQVIRSHVVRRGRLGRRPPGRGAVAWEWDQQVSVAVALYVREKLAGRRPYAAPRSILATSPTFTERVRFYQDDRPLTVEDVADLRRRWLDAWPSVRAYQQFVGRLPRVKS